MALPELPAIWEDGWSWMEQLSGGWYAVPSWGRDGLNHNIKNVLEAKRKHPIITGSGLCVLIGLNLVPDTALEDSKIVH